MLTDILDFSYSSLLSKETQMYFNQIKSAQIVSWTFHSVGHDEFSKNVLWNG